VYRKERIVQVPNKIRKLRRPSLPLTMLKRAGSLRESFGLQDGVGSIVAAAVRRRRSQVPLNPEEEGEKLDSSTSTEVDDSALVKTSPVIEETGYTLGDHTEYLHLRKDSREHHYCDVSHLLVNSKIPKLVKDFCSPIPSQRLNALYFGMESTTPPGQHEPLPVRTMVIRLRPDITSGVVMDALQEACEGYPGATASILKRHQGHFQCLVLSKEGEGEKAYTLDANICTSRGGALERELILRIFHTGDGIRKQKKAAKINKKSMDCLNNDDLIIPINLHLKGASSFLQHLSKQRCNNPLAVPSPHPSPKASTAYFLSKYEPNCSVRVTKELKNVPAYNLFPSLNSEDWAVLQSSWSMVSRIWKNLSAHDCLFHTIVDIPMVDEAEGDDSGPVLDFHYCSQIRQLSRDVMLAEVQSNFRDLQVNVDSMERSYQNFIRMLNRSLARFKMARYKPSTKPCPKLSLPPLTAPPGYAIVAAMACKCAEGSSDNPAALCDDAVLKVYKTFCSQDDISYRKHLKEANNAIMERLVEIQKSQMNLVHQLENHPNAQAAAKNFCKMARQATNTKGRVERLVLARVPLLDSETIGGRCQITSTAMLCTNEGMFDNKYHLFDFKAVSFQIVSGNCLAVVTTNSRETIYKINTAMDLPSLTEFLKTLQTLQSVFSISPKPAVQNDSAAPRKEEA
jgi:hypothetical protein